MIIQRRLKAGRRPARPTGQTFAVCGQRSEAKVANEPSPVAKAKFYAKFCKGAFSAHNPGAILLYCGLLAAGGAMAQKSVSELTLVYDYSTAGAAGDSAQDATHTVYIKGNKSRSEMTSSYFSSTTIFDGNTGFGVILREVNGQKLLIRMNPDNWTERNRMYDGIIYKNTNETREIAGYKCIKAVGQSRFGAVITVYYTRDIVPENRQYDPIFRNLEGLPLEYELTNGNVRIRYRIARINLNPVPVSKFDVPGTGYREMNYEESKKMNVN